MRSSKLEQKISESQEVLFADLFKSYRWGKVLVCPYCGSINIYTCKGRYKCRDCQNRFTDKTGTIMHHSKVPVWKWFKSFYLLMRNNGISSIELSRSIQVTQKTAWILLQKLRYALNCNDVLLNGIVAQDEMYVGGSWSYKHYGKKLLHLRNFGIIDDDECDYTKEQLFQGVSLTKHPVFGMIDDDGTVVLQSVPNPCEGKNLMKVIEQHNGNITHCVADESQLYDKWGIPITRMNHSKNKYKSCGLSSNAIEGVYSHFKRRNVATYVHQTEQFLQLYLNEFCFKWNCRKKTFEEISYIAFKKFSSCKITLREIREYNPFIQFHTKPRPRELFEKAIAQVATSGSIVSSIEVKGKVLRRGKDW